MVLLREAKHDLRPTDTKSSLATPDSAGQTTVCPYGLTFWESGLCDSDLV